MNASLFFTLLMPIPLPLLLWATNSFLQLAILHRRISDFTDISTLSQGFSICSERPCLNAFSKNGSISKGDINLSLQSPSTLHDISTLLPYRSFSRSM